MSAWIPYLTLHRELMPEIQVVLIKAYSSMSDQWCIHGAINVKDPDISPKSVTHIKENTADVTDLRGVFKDSVLRK